MFDCFCVLKCFCFEGNGKLPVHDAHAHGNSGLLTVACAPDQLGKHQPGSSPHCGGNDGAERSREGGGVALLGCRWALLRGLPGAVAEDRGAGDEAPARQSPAAARPGDAAGEEDPAERGVCAAGAGGGAGRTPEYDLETARPKCDRHQSGTVNPDQTLGNRRFLIQALFL